MSRKTFFAFFVIFFSPTLIKTILAWGFRGHQEINRAAVFTLPDGLFGFYKKHIDFVSAHAVDPDKRRYADPDEAPRHFIDLDRYGEHPFDSLPRHWEDAVTKYGVDSLKAHGIVPWHVMVMFYRLTAAFKAKDAAAILRHSADIGHYIADAHVPLHCTKNYNGQLTNQHGIHGLWESRLPELFDGDYDRITGTSAYLSNPSEAIWAALKDSYAAKDSVLELEKKLSSEFPEHRKFAYEQRGRQLVRVYSRSYCTAYHEALDGMVERRMNAAIRIVGAFWYSAWVNAGMPELYFEGQANPESTLIAEQDSLDKRPGNHSLPMHGHED